MGCTINNLDKTTQDILKQYTSHMYPDYWNGVLPQFMRDFADGKGMVDFGNFYNLDFIQHLAFPKMISTDGLDILSAGCGTGEAELFLSIKHPNVRFTAIDLSENSLNRAKSYASELGTRNIEFINGNILNIKLEKKFDIIISSGVIHHLSNPVAGLRNLKKYLKPDGIMVIMVYAEYGRYEIGIFQEVVKLIQNDRLDFKEGVNIVKEFLNNVKESSPLRHIQHMDDVEKGDNHIVDLLLNLNEYRYSVKTLDNLIQSADLKIINFLQQQTYDPKSYANSDFLNNKFDKLNFIEKAYMAELLNGHITKHCVICTHAEKEVWMPSIYDEGAENWAMKFINR